MRADADAGGHPARRSVQRRGVAWPEIEVIDASDAETMLAQRVPHDGISSVRIEGMIRALGLVLGDVTVGKDAVLDAQLCCFPAGQLLVDAGYATATDSFTVSIPLQHWGSCAARTPQNTRHVDQQVGTNRSGSARRSTSPTAGRETTAWTRRSSERRRRCRSRRPAAGSTATIKREFSL